MIDEKLLLVQLKAIETFIKQAKLIHSQSSMALWTANR